MIPIFVAILARRRDDSINASAVAIPDMSTTDTYRHKPHPHRWPKPVKTLNRLVRSNMMFHAAQHRPATQHSLYRHRYAQDDAYKRRPSN